MAEVGGGPIGGRYRLIEPVGQGGMGRVWRGHDEVLHREVAIKEILLPDGLAAGRRDVLIARVMREARAAARLNHPGIITVHDVVEHDGAPTIVMEFVSGRSLAAAIREEGRLPPGQVAAIGAAMVDALREAHAAGIVHRDLKPDNVLLTGRRTIITDFGIASLADATGLTNPGAVMGTPRYMAPEQIEGVAVTPACDMWSLGATLYAAVEGETPFGGTTLPSLFNAIFTKPPRPAAHAGPLRPVLDALLVKDPGRRATADQAARLLAGSGGSSPAADPVGATGASPVVRRPARRAVLFTGLGVAAAVAIPTGLVLASGADGGSDGSSDEVVLKGHTGNVYSVAFNHGGTLLATGSGDKTVRLWDLATRKTVGVLVGNGGTVFSVAFSPDGELLATGSFDGVVRLWDTTTHRQLAALKGHTGNVFSVALSSDSGMVASGGFDGTIRLWSATSRKGLFTVKGNGESVRSVAFSSDGQVVAGGGSDGTVRLRNSTSHADVLTYNDHAGAVNAVAFSADDTTVATGGNDRTVRFRDLIAATGPLTLKGHTGFITSVAYSSDNTLLASGAYDGTIRVWSMRSRTDLTSFHPRAPVQSVAFSPDGRTLASGGNDRTARLWQLP